MQTGVFLQSLKVPKSICTCGHEGDGEGSAHGGLLGHGACSVPGCDCEKFSWKDWVPAIKEILKKRGINLP